MPEPGVEFLGAARAAADLRRMAEELGPAVNKQGRSFAEQVAGRVSSQVPVLTGALAASVEVVDVEGGIGVAIGDGVPYAGWIEFGGSRGRPLVPEGRYLYPTALAAEEEFYSMATEIAEHTVERFPWSTPSH